MREKIEKFKVEWIPQKTGNHILSVVNKGCRELNNVFIYIDLGDGNDKLEIGSIPHFQPEDKNDFVFPVPEGYREDSNWEIEVTLSFTDDKGRHQNLKFTKTPKLR